MFHYRRSVGPRTLTRRPRKAREAVAKTRRTIRAKQTGPFQIIHKEPRAASISTSPASFSASHTPFTFSVAHTSSTPIPYLPRRECAQPDMTTLRLFRAPRCLSTGREWLARRLPHPRRSHRVLLGRNVYRVRLHAHARGRARHGDHAARVVLHPRGAGARGSGAHCGGSAERLWAELPPQRRTRSCWREWRAGSIPWRCAISCGISRR